MRFARFTFCCLLPMIAGAPLTAQQRAEGQPQDLKRLTIEELTEVRVTSVTRRPERVGRTAAAVSVVRQDDIHRSGTTTLPEALRLADAIDVAQVNGSSWGISTRGFNLSTANKLLVLVDGRSTYVPLFGGTFWDVQDTIVTDIDRIEVIRGPAGATWGANAMNGVVNVISKTAADTQGTQVTLVGGTNERAVASVRHGGRAGAGHYRLYGKFRHTGPQLLRTGGSAEDDTAFGQVGFRVDSSDAVRTRWFASGALYRGSLGFAERDNGRTSGGHLLARITRRTAGDGEFALQAYYDRGHRTIPLQFRGTRDTGEVDVQQSADVGRHSLVLSSTLRASAARDIGLAAFVFDPERRTSWTLNVFAQDEYELSANRAYLLAGAKAGRNNYTGFEVQPSLRFRVHPGARQIGWAAVSRAVRLPTRFDTDLRLIDPVRDTTLITGTADFDAESVLAYEAGYRVLLHAWLSLDTAVFTNRYDDLRSQERDPRGFIALRNLLNARTSGAEIAATVQATEAWQMHGSYAWLTKSMSFDSGSTDATGGVAEGNDPSHLASLRSHLQVTPDVSAFALLRYVGRRPAPPIPSYTELDLRIGWRVNRRWELSLIGQNLLHAAHPELFAGGPRHEFRRAVFVRSQWYF